MRRAAAWRAFSRPSARACRSSRWRPKTSSGRCAAEPAKDTAGRKGGLTQRLAGAASDGVSAGQGEAGDDLADLLEDQPAAPRPAAKQAPAGPAADGAGPPPTAHAPASAATPAASSPPDEDPLWFLTRRDEPATAEAPPGTEPILTPPEVVRATMPPFFGSAAEVAKPVASQPDASAPARPQPRAAEAPPSLEAAPAAAARAPSHAGASRGQGGGGEGRPPNATRLHPAKRPRCGAGGNQRRGAGRYPDHSRTGGRGARAAEANDRPVARPATCPAWWRRH